MTKELSEKAKNYVKAIGSAAKLPTELQGLKGYNPRAKAMEYIKDRAIHDKGFSPGACAAAFFQIRKASAKTPWQVMNDSNVKR
jgi:hypothetical protein